MIDNIVDQLVRDEDEILHAYQDSKGFWTIGVGHLIDKRKGGAIPQTISRFLLAYDIDQVTAQLQQHLPWTAKLDLIRFAALKNLCFNIGIEHLVGFHNTLTYLQQGDYESAAREMMNSEWAKEVGDRAKRLAEQVRTGIWQ